MAGRIGRRLYEEMGAREWRALVDDGMKWKETLKSNFKEKEKRSVRVHTFSQNGPCLYDIQRERTTMDQCSSISVRLTSQTF